MAEAPASPQLEDGFTRIANELLEALAGLKCPPVVMRVALAIIRETYGYNRKTAPVSRERMAACLGFSDRRVRQAIAEAEEWGLVVREGRELGLQKDYRRWRKPEDRPTGKRKAGVPVLLGDKAEDRGSGLRKAGVPVVSDEGAEDRPTGKAEDRTSAPPNIPPHKDKDRKKGAKRDPGDDTEVQAAIRDAFDAFSGLPLPDKMPEYGRLTKGARGPGASAVKAYAEQCRREKPNLSPDGDPWALFVEELAYWLKTFVSRQKGFGNRASSGKEPSAETKAAIAANRTVA